MPVYTKPMSLNEVQVSDLFFAFAADYISVEEAAKVFSEITEAPEEELIKDYNERL